MTAAGVTIDRRRFLGGVGSGSALALSGFVSPVAGRRHGGRARNGGITWPPSRALPRLRRAKHLDVLDVRELELDELFLTTLQGTVNRTRPRVYLLKAFEDGTFTWLNDLDVPYTVHDTASSIDSVVEGYLDEVETVVAYDPEVPATINVATTISGVERGVVAHPDHATELESSHDDLNGIDLRGRFDTGQDAYRWAYDRYWDETSDRHLVGQQPGQEVPVTDVTQKRQDYYRVLLRESERVRDSSNHGEHEIDLTPFLDGDAVYLRFDDAFPGAGWGPAVYSVRVETGDGDVVAEFKPTTDAEKPYLYNPDGSKTKPDDGVRFADGNSFFVYAFDTPADASELSASVVVENQYEISATTTQPPGPPETEFQPKAMSRDYAVATRAFTLWPNQNLDSSLLETILGEMDTNGTYLGWFGGDFKGEVGGTELCSRNSVRIAATDYSDNLSVFSGVKGHVGRHPAHRTDTPEVANKVYVTLTYSEGDNLQYDQHRMRALWDDDARGEVPLNWSISPLLADIAPAMMEYYQRTATRNDHLTCGPSGLGYMYPNAWPSETLDAYTKQTAKYMRRTDLNTIYMLNRENGQDAALSRSVVNSYAKNVDPDGVTLNFGGRTSAETTVREGKLARSKGPLVNDATQLVDVIESQIPDDWNGDEPAFVAVGLLAWNFRPSDFVDELLDLGSDYELVHSDEFFDLVRRSVDHSGHYHHP